MINTYLLVDYYQFTIVKSSIFHRYQEANPLLKIQILNWMETGVPTETKAGKLAGSMNMK